MGCVLLSHVAKRGYQEARELLSTPSLLPNQGLKVGLSDLGGLSQPKWFWETQTQGLEQKGNVIFNAKSSLFKIRNQDVFVA